ncbi:hypothetical protein ACIP5Y_18485 [Nocardia sp. NPDC088792]|uniref:hypothetical protein n=1 Tax=Nocardia sp. NPDC088792 TaxID=3364332 RepID=UPI003812B622
MGASRPAASAPTTAQQHFLTTTVQLSEPTFETGIHTAQVRGLAGTGRLEFNATGVRVANEVGAYGEVLAYKVVSNLVKAQRVEGMPSGIGGIDFTAFGIQVSNTSGGESVVITDRIVANLVSAKRVQGPSNSDGSITFPESGIQVRNGAFDNAPAHGSVFAENGIYQNQSFSKGSENRWINLSDGPDVSVVHRHADGTTTYGNLKVSRIETDAARW